MKIIKLNEAQHRKLADILQNRASVLEELAANKRKRYRPSERAMIGADGAMTRELYNCVVAATREE